jgi:1-acyl-sn-glycerol-3-phosphate acyltransferase
MYEATRILATPLFLLWRPRYLDDHHVPPTGAAILAPNHFSFLDHFFVGLLLRRRLLYMSKSQLFTFPLTLWLAAVSAFPIRRGQRDEDAFATARAALARGDVLIMYAEGGRARPGELGSAKPGVGRLALETGVTVVPVAIEGTQRLGQIRRLRFPRVTVRYGAPIRFERVEAPRRGQALAASQEIFARVRSMHAELAG